MKSDHHGFRIFYMVTLLYCDLLELRLLSYLHFCQQNTKKIVRNKYFHFSIFNIIFNVKRIEEKTSKKKKFRR